MSAQADQYGEENEKSSDEEPSTSSSSYESSSSSGSPDAEGGRPTKKQKNDSKKRIRTTPEQLRTLEKTYEREKIPSQGLREELALKLGMTARRVQVWFQNKRAKERRLKKSLRQQQHLSNNNHPHHEGNYQHQYQHHPEYHQFVQPTTISKLTIFPVHTYPRNEPIALGQQQHNPASSRLNASTPAYCNSGIGSSPSSLFPYHAQQDSEWKRLPPFRYICNEI